MLLVLSKTAFRTRADELGLEGLQGLLGELARRLGRQDRQDEDGHQLLIGRRLRRLGLGHGTKELSD